MPAARYLAQIFTMFNSPTLSLEISAFGSDGEGDDGDTWKVECKWNFWLRDEAVGFKHVDTGT